MAYFSDISSLWNYLNSIPNFSKNGSSAYNPGLKNIQQFCERIGNPQNQFRSIHIAGTNGKGTVCSMLSAMCIQNEYKTGLYTSPHLLKLNERIKINGTEISDESLLKFYNLYYTELQNQQLTYFEQLTACAFWYFAKEKVDIAIIETGLGGRLDATNVITPIVSIITSIGLDHQDILGDSEPLIAAEKAGIIKKNIPVCTGLVSNEALQVIKSIAQLNESKLITFDPSKCISTSSQTCSLIIENQSLEVELDFSGRINHLNAWVSLQALNSIRKILPTDTKKNCAALTNTKLIIGFRGRFERLVPNRNWFFDGAHNVQAATMLVESMKSIAPLDSWTVICSFMRDKNSKEILNLYQKCKKIYFFEIKSERAATFNEISMYFSSIKTVDDFHIPPLLESLRNDTVIFTGSFFLYAIVKDWMVRLSDDT